MTTNDNVDVIEEPNDDVIEEPEYEDENNEPRSIGALLALGTYQGMTDEEIERVIEHKFNIWLGEEIAKSRINGVVEAQDRQLELYAQTAAVLNEMVEYNREILSKTHSFESSNETYNKFKAIIEGVD